MTQKILADELSEAKDGSSMAGSGPTATDGHARVLHVDISNVRGALYLNADGRVAETPRRLVAFDADTATIVGSQAFEGRLMPQTFASFIKDVATQGGMPSAVRMDNSKEFRAAVMDDAVRSLGMEFHFVAASKACERALLRSRLPS